MKLIALKKVVSLLGAVVLANITATTAVAAVDQNNYCNTTCISHQETVRFGKDRDLTFDMNAAKLRAIRSMENKIKELGKDRGLVACVAGHTDSDASSAYNTRLSLRRAKNIARDIRRAGLARDISILVRGYGEVIPIASNATEAGKAENRRVVVQYGYNKRAGETCLRSGISERAAPEAAGSLNAKAIALGLLAVGAIAAVIAADDDDDSTTGTAAP